VKVYTRTGDDGTTGLLYGSRVAKNAPGPAAYGDVDELQAFIGLARAHSEDEAISATLVEVCRDLWVLMAELATAHENRHKLELGATLVEADAVARLEGEIDRYSERFEPPKAFVVPGQSVASAYLDVARTVARRAERSALVAAASDSMVVPYLNRLSDLLWTLARASEATSLLVKDVTPSSGGE
jgi:cob(I)alamin adenosyltransferase